MPLHTSHSLAAIFAVTALICARLGVWQLDRLSERRTANATAAASRALPVVALQAELELADSFLANRRVAAVGRYDHDREIVLRGQVYAGVPGVQLVTPLLLAGTDTAVLVNRGFVPTPDATTPPSSSALREAGRVHVEGIALPIAAGGDGKPISRHGHTTWARLDLAALRATLPYPIIGVYVRRLATDTEEGRFPRALPAPPLDDGPHLSYALQWFGFAGLALVFAGIVWWKRP